MIQRLEIKINTAAPTRAVAQSVRVVRFPNLWTPIASKPGTGATKSRKTINAIASMIAASAIRLHAITRKHRRLACLQLFARPPPRSTRI